METIKLLKRPDFVYSWEDALNPSAEVLSALAQTYTLPKHLILSSLEADHMPTIQHGENYRFIIFRSHDENAKAHSDTVTELTRKICLFIGKDWLLTIHRGEMTWFTQTIDEVLTCGTPHNLDALVDFILNKALQTYEKPIVEYRTKIDYYEDAVFLRDQDNLSLIKELFHLKRKIFLLKRLIHNCSNVAEELPDIKLETQNHELHYYCNKLAFQYEELAELITSLMSLNLALSDHRTNDVMRILTIFSVFFLPLTFVVGVYGMNFEYMPELQSKFGYPATLIGMVIATLLLYLWFRRKGWLRP